jgi:hypothetical protein
MGIYYGDVHYGIRISKKVVIDGDTFLEPVRELIFDESREDVLTKVADMYYKLLEPSKYRYELLVDVYTTYDGTSSYRGWQVINAEQMTEFIAGKHKIGKCREDET